MHYPLTKKELEKKPLFKYISKAQISVEGKNMEPQYFV